MQVEEVLAELGGVATRAELLAHVTDAALRRALAEGVVDRPARGRYRLPDQPWFTERVSLRELASAGRRAAHEVSGTAILLTAAARWGWRMKWVPTRPQVAVPRGRKVSAGSRRSLDVRWRHVPARDRDDGWVTDRVRTAMDCAVLLPADEALAVLDSALREDVVDRDELGLAAAALPRQHRARVTTLVDMATEKAANPFESVLRWIVSDIPGMTVQPQVEIFDDDGKIGRVDLADEELRIAIEADSFEWHGKLEHLERDCIRYNRLVAEGWLVLRFSWDQVMNHPERVRDIVARTVALRDSRVRRHGRQGAQSTAPTSGSVVIPDGRAGRRTRE